MPYDCSASGLRGAHYPSPYHVRSSRSQPALSSRLKVEASSRRLGVAEVVPEGILEYCRTQLGRALPTARQVPHPSARSPNVTDNLMASTNALLGASPQQTP